MISLEAVFQGKDERRLQFTANRDGVSLILRRLAQMGIPATMEKLTPSGGKYVTQILIRKPHGNDSAPSG